MAYFAHLFPAVLFMMFPAPQHYHVHVLRATPAGNARNNITIDNCYNKEL